jgi:hypothetical protein
MMQRRNTGGETRFSEIRTAAVAGGGIRNESRKPRDKSLVEAQVIGRSNGHQLDRALNRLGRN